jgi:arginine decarboxylase
MNSGQAQAPYLDALERFAATQRVGFHVPGHVQGAGAHARLRSAFGDAVLRLDLCSGLEGPDGCPDSALEEAQRLAAEAFGADRTWFLVNGSTIGNQIMLSAVCRAGDRVLTSRNTHKSVLSALVVSGATPVYLPAETDPANHLAHGVLPESVVTALRSCPDAAAVMLVSPTYYGACSDIAAIADVCHGHGIPLLVDEAWGPHFPFHPELPAHALSLGADAAVTGIHKLLGALTQASMLHVRGPLIDPARVETVAELLQTTSPSCLLFASLDVARMQMATEGRSRYDSILTMAREARIRLNSTPGLSVLSEAIVGHFGVAALDPTRLCVNVAGIGRTGYDVASMLAQDYDIDVEMSDFTHVVANLTIGHTADDVHRLCDALEDVAASGRSGPTDPAGFIEALHFEQPVQAISPRAAFDSPHEALCLSDAVGRVAAELVASYPPGIPVIVPGERITRAIVDFLQAQLHAGARMVGVADPTLATIRVVQ